MRVDPAAKTRFFAVCETRGAKSSTAPQFGGANARLPYSALVDVGAGAGPSPPSRPKHTANMPRACPSRAPSSCSTGSWGRSDPSEPHLHKCSSRRLLRGRGWGVDGSCPSLHKHSGAGLHSGPTPSAALRARHDRRLPARPPQPSASWSLATKTRQAPCAAAPKPRPALTAHGSSSMSRRRRSRTTRSAFTTVSSLYRSPWPSRPSPASPHECSAPRPSTAAVCAAPSATSRTPERPRTSTGWLRLSLPPPPPSPELPGLSGRA